MVNTPKIVISDVSEQHIPRPPNAWVCFRAVRARELLDHCEKPIRQADISRILQEEWRALDAEIKDRWFAVAAKLKEDHKLKYPNYKFKPVRRGSKKGHRRTHSGASSSMDSTNEAYTEASPAMMTVDTGTYDSNALGLIGHTGMTRDINPIDASFEPSPAPGQEGSVDYPGKPLFWAAAFYNGASPVVPADYPGMYPLPVPQPNTMGWPPQANSELARPYGFDDIIDINALEQAANTSLPNTPAIHPPATFTPLLPLAGQWYADSAPTATRTLSTGPVCWGTHPSDPWLLPPVEWTPMPASFTSTTPMPAHLPPRAAPAPAVPRSESEQESFQLEDACRELADCLAISRGPMQNESGNVEEFHRSAGKVLMTLQRVLSRA